MLNRMRVGFAALIAAVLVLDAGAQSWQFRSATIKPAKAAVDGPGSVVFGSKGRLTATSVTLQQLIENAYRRSGYDRREVTGGPEWIATDRFDIDAEAGTEHLFEPSGFPRTSLLMLRQLLSDRFQLRLAPQLQPRQIYELKPLDITKPPRLKPSTADCAAVMRAEAKGERANEVVCGVSVYPGRLVARGVTLTDFASLLSPYLGRPVIDRTTIDGTFDIEIEAVEFTSTRPSGPSDRPSDTKQSIVQAIEAQLGLRLEDTAGAIEVLVVESATRPSSD